MASFVPERRFQYGEQTHEQALVSVLRRLHDDLDAKVFEAYGWPASLPDEQIIGRLVALNANGLTKRTAASFAGSGPT